MNTNGHIEIGYTENHISTNVLTLRNEWWFL